VPADELESELRATPPPGVQQLDDASRADLAAAIRDARHRQAAALQAAGEQALRHIPRVLRIPLKKALG
jgi:hypothetical protein